MDASEGPLPALGGLSSEVVRDGGRQPFRREPDFGVTSVNYSLSELLVRAEEPA
jgi:hypothetical protein